MRIALITLAASASALAQDCGFDTTIGNPGATGGYMAPLEIFDDGNGPALYGAGRFLEAGGAPANRIATWDGATWSPLAGGVDSDFVNDLAVYNDILYVGGFFSGVDGGLPGTANLAGWDGSQWLDVDAQLFGSAWALKVLDIGDGEKLYVGGDFIGIGGILANNIAVFDGDTWSPLGLGVIGGATIVFDIEVYDDGRGPALYVCGRFTTAGGIPADHIARWDGESWEGLDFGLGGTQVVNLTVYDDGDGEKLYATGGTITPPGEPSCSVARWDGEDWESVGAPLGNLVWDLFPYDDGNGEALYAIGAYDDQDLDLFMKWDGEEWIDLGYGFDGSIFDSIVFDDGNGKGRFISGAFTQGDGGPVNGIIKLEECATCAADCNADGNLNILDFVCFQGEWQNQTEAGDCDGNGLYNILDFVCFQGQFVAGCP